MTVTQYLGQDVPEAIQTAWKTVEGARWRIRAHLNNNEVHPPTQHTSVAVPNSLCKLHRSYWLQWRNKEFNQGTGDRWPGTFESPLSTVDTNLVRLREERRAEWDRKTLDAMEGVEETCSSGKSCDNRTPMAPWHGDGYRRWKSDNGPVVYEISGYCPATLYSTVYDNGESIEFVRKYPNDRAAKKAAREDFEHLRGEGIV